MCDVSAIPGLAGLWRQTTGDSRIRLAVLDGPVEHGHPAFDGADFARLGGTPSPGDFTTPAATHGTAVASVIFGGHGGAVTGIAPGLAGVSVPVFHQGNKTSQLELARGIELAADAGAHVINISGGQLSPPDEADGLLAGAVRTCLERNILVVAAAGNNGCFCTHVPAALPSVLAVGALDDDGMPLAMSNWGAAYRSQGILAPGANIPSAVPGGGTATNTGTSLATPIVAGIAGLLLSLQIRAGRDPDPLAIGAVLLDSADLCDWGDPDKCARYLAGKLNVERAVRTVTRNLIDTLPEAAETVAAPASPAEADCGCGHTGDTVATPELVTASCAPDRAAEPAIPAGPPSVTPSTPPAADSVVTSTDPQAVANSQLVYAVGVLGYDFGTEARRDSFKQLMAPSAQDGTVVPANPYDARQMVDHLRAYPSEAKALVWTLNLELTPIYAVEPSGPYAADVYDLLTRLLAGQVADEADATYIERIALPGRLSGRTVRLFSGQTVPVVEIEHRRGLYGWEVNRLTESAVEAVSAVAGGTDATTVGGSLREFLTRVYYDLRNLGATSRDRALNFAATNAFQATRTLAAALADGMALDSIGVEQSPFGRPDSDCWDVKLRFFDPENSRRAKRVYRFTIDVSDTLPVTLGEVRAWSEA